MSSYGNGWETFFSFDILDEPTQPNFDNTGRLISPGPGLGDFITDNSPDNTNAVRPCCQHPDARQTNVDLSAAEPPSNVLQASMAPLSPVCTLSSTALEDLMSAKNKIIALQDELLILKMERQRKHNQVKELLAKVERMQNTLNWIREMAQYIIGDEPRCLGDQTDP
jgi:hypothetical protein